MTFEKIVDYIDHFELFENYIW